MWGIWLIAALMRDERKVMLLGKHSAGKPKIQIYSSSGIPLSTITVYSALIPGEL
jgi:hypothetical protein